ncbi:MAG: TMEM175 family protein [Candidatus Cybelea sp.]
MPISYNEIAGRSLERLASLSDGVFAFAMTLLVLDLRLPVAEAVHSEAGLRVALTALAPNLLTYFLSFMTLGIFWVGQHTQLSKLKHSQRTLTWIHLIFLLMVTMIPFSTKLLAAFITYRTALVIYWLNILGLGASLYWSWSYARKANLIKEEAPAGIDVAVRGRIIIAQALYAVGALLCLVNTYVSIGFIVLVQLNYVFAPRLGLLRRF